MLHQVVRAILPALSLRDVLDQWNLIADALSEPPRTRCLQMEKLPKTS
mgnify:CR=1 FL=1|jgi:hypothetical protein